MNLIASFALLCEINLFCATLGKHCGREEQKKKKEALTS